MTDVSVIILQKNEALHIKRCLEKLAPLEPRQIFVVDCFSTDGSDKTAAEMGATVVQREWPGLYAPQLNWALENLPIESEWVMRLDADEYFLPEAIEELKEKLPQLSDDITGVISKRRHYIFGGWAKRGTYPVKLLRIFRRGKAICEERYMDEHMQLKEGRAVEFDYDFVDHNLNSFEWWREKHRGYAKREAMDALEIMEELKAGGKSDVKIDGQAAIKRKKKYQYYRLPPYFRAVLYFCIRRMDMGGDPASCK
jgi:glycosyltransferase involved in cell wall biosynthesis